MSDYMRKLAAECFGTYALVFVGTGAIIVNDLTGGTVSHVGVALTFGLIVLGMIYTIGDVSGCHINPAVTIGFFLSQRFAASMVLPYIGSQVLGAVLASSTLHVIFPGHISLGATFPAGSALQSFILEFNLTLILMFAILSVTSSSKEQGTFAGVAIGSIVALEALFAGPICGASMNPARSIGPAIVSLSFNAIWIYLTAPVLGAFAAVVLCRITRGKKCCSTQQAN